MKVTKSGYHKITIELSYTECDWLDTCLFEYSQIKTQWIIPSKPKVFASKLKKAITDAIRGWSLF